MKQIRALRSSRASLETAPDAHSIHEQHITVHEELARSVHADPALAAVIAAWPTLAEALRANILRLIETGEVAP